MQCSALDDEMADAFTYDEIEMTHHGLRLLASFDPDYAAELNGIVFNRLDGQIVHEHAARPTLSGREAALGVKLLAKLSSTPARRHQCSHGRSRDLASSTGSSYECQAPPQGQVI